MAEAGKAVLFAFNGEMMCFVHALLHAQDLKARGFTVALIVEGSATKLAPELAEQGHPMHGLWQKVLDAGLLSAVCRACSDKMGVLDQVKALGLPLGEDMAGHPAMGPWLRQGYQVITF